MYDEIFLKNDEDTSNDKDSCTNRPNVYQGTSSGNEGQSGISSCKVELARRASLPGYRIVTIRG
eukprot:8905753-Karenia_brevis.AAC.1